jgi:hypothetical protein
MTQRESHAEGVSLLEAYNAGFNAGRNNSDALEEALVTVMMSVLACAERYGIDLDAAMARRRLSTPWREQAGNPRDRR